MRFPLRHSSHAFRAREAPSADVDIGREKETSGTCVQRLEVMMEVMEVVMMEEEVMVMMEVMVMVMKVVVMMMTMI